MSCFFRLYVDIDGFQNPSILFKSRQQQRTNQAIVNTNNLTHRARPDIIIEERDRITVIELTCPYETNLKSSREYKLKRYENLRNELVTPVQDFEIILLEVSSLGFVTEESKRFRTVLNELLLPADYIVKKCQEVAIRSSYYIYCRRNKCWNSPDLISYD